MLAYNKILKVSQRMSFSGKKKVGKKYKLRESFLHVTIDKVMNVAKALRLRLNITCVNYTFRLFEKIL